MRKPAPRRRFRPLVLEPIEPRRLLAFAAELVADVEQRNLSPSTFPREITDLGGMVLYMNRTSTYGEELWRSDGTKAGTTLVKDILSGPEWSTPKELTNVNGIVYFTARSELGRELWRSDGTPEGTWLVKDILLGSGWSNPQNLVNVNGTLFFSAKDAVHGRELWKSDGTSEGTTLVRDVTRGGSGSTFRNTVTANGR